MKKYSNERQQKIAEKIVETYPVDERVSAVNNKGLAACGVIAILYCIGRIIYVGFAKDNLALPEFVLLIVMVVAITFVERRNHVYNFPKTMSGREINTEPTKKGKKKRILYYFEDSAVFAAAMTAATYIFEKDSREFSTLAAEFATCIIILFLLDFILTENQVKGYNKYLKSLDEDDEE